MTTKSGVKLEVRNGVLYTENEPEIFNALNEDVNDENPNVRAAARNIIIAMQAYGVVAEVHDESIPDSVIAQIEN